MVELNDKYWEEQKENKATLNGDTLIYWPLQYRTFYNNILYYYYRHRILSLKSGTTLDTLDDLRLSTKSWIWYLRWHLNPTMTPITFEEFLDNRSLSKYIQKASKETNYGNSNRNRNNDCKQ